jgi:hypothetical protein
MTIQTSVFMPCISSTPPEVYVELEEVKLKRKEAKRHSLASGFLGLFQPEALPEKASTKERWQWAIRSTIDTQRQANGGTFMALVQVRVVWCKTSGACLTVAYPLVVYSCQASFPRSWRGPS